MCFMRQNRPVSLVGPACLRCGSFEKRSTRCRIRKFQLTAGSRVRVRTSCVLFIAVWHKSEGAYSHGWLVDGLVGEGKPNSQTRCSGVKAKGKYSKKKSEASGRRGLLHSRF
ncbi:unnamed protein product [Hapterophycus canaliculatus]